MTTSVSPASSLWTGHLAATASSRSPLLLAQAGRQAQRHRERERREVLVLDIDVDLDRADVPPFARRVHLHRHRGAAGEAGGDEAGGGGAGVGAALDEGGLVDDERVAALDLDVVDVSLAAAGYDLHG